MQEITGETATFTDSANRILEISKFGNLIKWVDEQGVDHIERGSGESREGREGYAFVIAPPSDSEQPEVIFDVYDDRSNNLIPVSFTANSQPGSMLANGDILDVIVETMTADGRFKITSEIKWKAGENKVDINRSIKNLTGSVVTLEAAKAHASMVVLKSAAAESIGITATPINSYYDPDAPNDDTAAPGEGMVVMNSFNRGPCPPPPGQQNPEDDPCESALVSVSREEGESFGDVSFNTAAVVTKIAMPFSKMNGEFKSAQVNTPFTAVLDEVTDVTLSWAVNKELAPGDHYSFTTHYRYRRPANN